MKNIVFAIATVAVFAISGTAGAAEARGAVKSVVDRTMTIDTNYLAGLPNGPAGVLPNLIVFTVPGAAGGPTDMLAGMIPGTVVTVTYTTAGTVNTVSKVVK